MVTELRQALERAQSDPDVSIIVLTGAGGNFCAGDDLKESEHQTAEDFLALIMDLQRITRLLLLGKKPTIAAMDGYAVGGGFELALACDFRVASTAHAWDVWKRVLAWSLQAAQLCCFHNWWDRD